MSFPAELFLSCLLVFRRVSCFIDVDGGSQSPCTRFLYCAMIMAAQAVRICSRAAAHITGARARLAACFFYLAILIHRFCGNKIPRILLAAARAGNSKGIG